ncbi:Uncharacterised protein [Mycobacteroides abscessus subsp. abscessus]|nr:Uncharacterised protein [Mycobacteroides abscessus subsp. abscessus]
MRPRPFAAREGEICADSVVRVSVSPSPVAVPPGKRTKASPCAGAAAMPTAVATAPMASAPTAPRRIRDSLVVM